MRVRPAELPDIALLMLTLAVEESLASRTLVRQGNGCKEGSAQ